MGCCLLCLATAQERDEQWQGASAMDRVLSLGTFVCKVGKRLRSMHLRVCASAL